LLSTLGAAARVVAGPLLAAAGLPLGHTVPPTGFGRTSIPSPAGARNLGYPGRDEAAPGRMGPGDPQRAGLRHRPLQLSLPLLHAGRGSRVAGAGRAAQLRGDRAPRA